MNKYQEELITVIKDNIYTEHYYRNKYYRGKSLFEWCLLWFKTSNDSFYRIYGFNFNPHKYHNLYEIVRKKLY